MPTATATHNDPAAPPHPQTLASQAAANADKCATRAALTLPGILDLGLHLADLEHAEPSLATSTIYL